MTEQSYQDAMLHAAWDILRNFEEGKIDSEQALKGVRKVIKTETVFNGFTLACHCGRSVHLNCAGCNLPVYKCEQNSERCNAERELEMRKQRSQ